LKVLRNKTSVCAGSLCRKSAIKATTISSKHPREEHVALLWSPRERAILELKRLLPSSFRRKTVEPFVTECIFLDEESGMAYQLRL